MNIVLLEPEIPYNTGAIGRSCVITNSKLHLIRPFGFKTDEKSIKKAGLDYWNDIHVSYYDDYKSFLKANNYPPIFMATTKAKKNYTQVKYSMDSYIMFGKESKGIPEEILLENENNCIRIPMLKDKRSLNLAISASIILYEGLRQNDFYGLEKEGNFPI